MKRVEKFWFLFLLMDFLISFHTTEAISVKASVSLFHFNRTVFERCECSLYGFNSPCLSAQGMVGIPVSADLYACDRNTDFTVMKAPWIALIERGNCSFAEKIQVAARRGATAAMIYNSHGKGHNSTLLIAHQGAEKIVAIMIGNLKGMEILHRIRNGMKVTMVIEVGKKRSLSVNIFTILFISVSFFVVAAATVGCYVSYSARRLIIARAQSREQRQLRAKAKKAIEQMKLRTLKEGDKETGPDGDSCVVCFEQYKPNDVMRVLTCNHVFHKTCIDPWLLEHGTCPLCKCDILKVLGVKMDVEPRSEPVQAPGSSGQRPLSTVTIVNEEDNLSETASSGYDSVQGPDESAQEAHTPLENHNTHPVRDESQPSTVIVLSHGDNPGFEGDDTQVCEGRIVCEVTF
ncbi:LOW QUALITY PROTEIN: E3 ubiquitin-protein ligase RNF128-like [Cyanistes caeruleus]|uniref:LOW QUALITY PROTEIN: E3 ubiquitin-protein ligase RNF128-like n=1 Tax=Cyanistes caeruleus TaxID=156563 RepID=UPI000CDAC9F2|nr:LOW QUALITY PROTEIN: E3 ubiquitin-protein ligase RNF128-like [Cyanistes caeruleus]